MTTKLTHGLMFLLMAAEDGSTLMATFKMHSDNTATLVNTEWVRLEDPPDLSDEERGEK